MKNLPRGRTTSREATPLGDPRGVPKQFSTFWSFSKNFPKRSTKHISKSLPICLEGFGNRSKHSSQSVIQRIEVNDLVNILALKTSPSHMRIHLNLKMESTENPILVDLIDFFNHTDFSGVEGTTLNLNELLESSDSDSELQDNSNTVTSSQPSDDFRYSEVQSSFVDSSVNETQQEFEMNPVESQQHLAPLPSFSTNQDVISPVQIQDSVHQTPSPTPTPHFQHLHTVSIPAQSQQQTLPQIFIQIPGTNQLQLVQVVADNSQLLSALPGPAGSLNISPSSFNAAQSVTTEELSINLETPSFTYNSHSSISSPSSVPSPSTSSLSLPSPSSLSTLSSPPSTKDEYLEMRRKNNEACRNYRERKKTKQELADEELKELQLKNDLLNKKVKHMESIIKGIRAKVITNITQPRVMKRERSRDLDDTGHPGNKKSRWEP